MKKQLFVPLVVMVFLIGISAFISATFNLPKEAQLGCVGRTILIKHTNPNSLSVKCQGIGVNNGTYSWNQK